jgi:V/A-type H+-transporting ATPase subunit F
MRMVCISNSNDISVGLKLAGVQSFFIRDSEEIKKKIKEIAEDSNVGILNVTEGVYEIAKEELDKISNEQELPLVVKIPNSK